MPAYVWKGKTRDGKAVAGERVADNKEAVMALLRRDQILVTSVKEKGKRDRAAQARRRRAVEGPRDLHAPVLGHDRRRPAARAVPRDPGQPAGEQDLRQGPAADPHGRRGRRQPRRRHAQAPQGLRRPLHQHDRGRRGGRYPRHDPEAPRDLHREGVKLKAQVKGAMVYPVAVLGIAGIVIAVILWKVIPTFAAMFAGLERRAAAADALRHRAEQLVRPPAAVPRRRRRARRDRLQALLRDLRRPARRRPDAPAGCPILGIAHAEDRGGALLPHAGDPDLLRRADPRRPRDHRPHRGQRDHRGRDHGRAQGRRERPHHGPAAEGDAASSRRWSCR